jgi:hypothetical protein
MRTAIALVLLGLGTGTAWAGGPETLAFWAKVNEMIGQGDRFRSNYVTESTPEMRRDQMCRDLLALPSEGVDREVLLLVREVVAYAPIKAKADAQWRWYHVAGYRVPKEVTEANARRDALIAEAARVQKACEERHGVSFPAFRFPNW